MPDVASGIKCSLLLVHHCPLDTQENALSGSYLVRAHNHQVLIYREHAILREDIQQCSLGKEGLCEISEV